MTVLTGEVHIARPVAEVYDLYTDARLTAEHSSGRTEVSFTNVVEDGPGTQAVWMFIYPELKTEMVETVVEVDRPHRITSHLQITRVLPLAPHEVTPGVMPALAYNMRDDYSPLFGKLPAEGVQETSFTPDGDGTVLRVTTQIALGGWSRISGWFMSRSKRSPLQRDLEAFRDRLEAMRGTG
ncbi:polyketide cyclase/dehydrase/lipid transport protein [Litoreibacter meonggei]|uniref:Polyketide cyclase/dehydrase/lipid transport protein n=1 Tax=Litoreibacter meonggei TaxID=1049199 RepID=A0A497WYJ4_9RHOB|nr:SRPBCC family protein [Litoreibacter meonggei]RLJ59338.1 polyketide cyclase/dehydrase/lipid transport protein [Litoreibacter meonggei]